MSDNMLSRRELLAGIGTSGLIASGIVINKNKSKYESRHNGEFPFSKPILDLDFSAVDIGYPQYYQQILRDQSEIDRLFKREYVQSEFPAVVDMFDMFDMSNAFITVFGVLMPRTRKLRPTDDNIRTNWLAGPGIQSKQVLSLEYDVVKRNSASDDKRFHTVVRYWETNGSRPPDSLRVEIRHGGASVSSEDT